MLSALALLSLLATSPAEESRARDLVKRLLIEYDLGNVQAALDDATEAYRIDPRPELLFNLGQCHRALGNWDKARFFYRGYLRHVPDADNRGLVQALIVEMEGKANGHAPPPSSGARPPEPESTASTGAPPPNPDKPTADGARSAESPVLVLEAVPTPAVAPEVRAEARAPRHALSWALSAGALATAITSAVGWAQVSNYYAARGNSSPSHPLDLPAAQSAARNASWGEPLGITAALATAALIGGAILDLVKSAVALGLGLCLSGCNFGLTGFYVDDCGDGGALNGARCVTTGTGTSGGQGSGSSAGTGGSTGTASSGGNGGATGSGCGQARFALTGSPVVLGQPAEALAVADFNRDGLPDLAIAGANAPLQILDGPTAYPVSEVGAVALRAADFNHDGWTDLAYAAADAGTVTLLINAEGGFTTADSWPIGTDAVLALVSADLFRTGDETLLYADGTVGEVQLLSTTGGSFVDAGVLAFAQVDALAVDDFNGDGLLDVAVASQGSEGGLGIFSQTKTGGFTGPVGVGDAQGPRFSLLSGDFDRDGRPDLADLRQLSGGQFTVEILLNRPAEEWESNDIPVDVAPSALAVADVDGDGLLDLIVADSANTGEAELLLGDGEGHFAVQASYALAVAGRPMAVVSADFNQDGRADVALASVLEGGTGAVSFLLGSGACHCGWSGLAQPQVLATQLPAQSVPNDVVTADFDGDGKPDILVTGDCSVDLLLGDGTGGFTAQPSVAPWPSGGNAVYPAVADFDGDGLPDVLVALNQTNQLHLLSSVGAGRLTVGSVFELGTTPGPFTVADFDGDGWPDVAASDNGASAFEVLFNDHGGFGAQASYPLSFRPTAIVGGDFNGDGLSDLAVAGGQSLWIFENLGQGLFSTTAVSMLNLAGSTIDGLVAADFDGNGTLDLAVLGGGGGNPLTLVQRSAAGQYSGQSPLDFPTVPAAAIAADFNGDGRLDLVVADVNGFVTPYLGVPGPGFGFSAAASVQLSSVYGLTVGDFNRDGSPDLAAASGNSGSENAVVSLGGCR